MYCSHFGLHRSPFNNTPDPTFYYSTPEHEEALATLQYATFQRKGFVMVTGEIGAGKTLIGRMFLRQVDRNAAVAVITHTNLTGRQLLAAICAEFELDVAPDASNLQLAERLQDFLLDQFAKDRFAVVVLDEAQNLPDESFEELRMLGNLEADDAKLLQICILGQPELRERFRHPNLKPMNQRLFRRFHLPSLNREHMEGYILHRLEVAGCTHKDLFTPGALDLIYTASQGIPRLVNQICDNALLTAYGAGVIQVDAHIINLATEKELLPASEQTPSSEKVEVATPPMMEHPTTTVTTKPAPAAPPIVVQAGMAHEAVDKSNTALELARQQADQIAQTRDEIRTLTERTLQTKDEQQAVLQQACQQYQAAQDKLGAFRNEIQGTFDEVAGQYQSIKRQFEELSQTTVPAFELEQLRQTHLRETHRMLEEINKQRAEFKSLLEVANQQWHETRDQVIELANESASGAALAGLESEFEDKLVELLARLDQQRKHIADLAQIFHDQCLQTRNDLQELRRAQEQADSKLAEEIDRKLTETQADLDTRIGRHEERIRLLNQHLADQVAATEKALSQLEIDSATAADLEQIRKEQTTAIGDILKQIDDQAGQLAGFKDEIAQQTQQASEAQEMLINEVSDRAASQDERIQQLRHKVLQYVTSTKQRFAALHEQFAGRAEVEELRKNQQQTAVQLRTEQQTAAEKIRAEQQIREQQLLEQQQAAVDDLRTEQQTVVEKLSAEHQKTAEQIRKEQQVCAREILEQQQVAVDGLRSEQQTVAEKLSVEHQKTAEQLRTEQQIRAQQLLEQQQAAVDGLRFEQKTAAEIIRSEHQETVEQLRNEQQVREQQLLEQQQAAVDELRTEQQAADEKLRAEQQERADEIRKCHRTDMDELCKTHDAMTADMLHRIELNRKTTKRLIGSVVERFRSTREQLDTIMASRASNEQLDELRTRQEAESTRLLQQLERQEQALAQQFEHIATRLQQAAEEIETLSGTMAPITQLEQLRQHHADDREQILTTLSAQRRDMESLVAGVSARCEEMTLQLDALPNDIATVGQIDAIREEHAQQVHNVLNELAERKSQLEQAIARVADHCDQTHATVDALAKHAASAADVRQLREQHTHKMREILQRIDHQDTKHDSNVSILTRKIKDNVRRVVQLEEMERPKPIRIELTPKAGNELGQIVEAAQQQHGHLCEAANRAGAIAAHLHNASSQVQEALQHWAVNADQVQAQSDKLRESAKTAARILQAMEKCHAVLDKKLNSQRWQAELARGESLTDRLEQATRKAVTVTDQLHAALRDFEQCQGIAEDWTNKHIQAKRTSEQLSKLLDEATSVGSKVEQSLTQRKRMLNAVAQNTARLMETIEAARQDDEQQRPITRPDASKTKQNQPDAKRIRDVDWPRFRTHSTIKAG